MTISNVYFIQIYALTFGRISTDSASWMRPPVGVASGVWQPLQKTGTLECENAVVNCVHVGQRSERNSERGFGTSVFFLFMWSSCSTVGCKISQSSVDIRKGRPRRHFLVYMTIKCQFLIFLKYTFSTSILREYDQSFYSFLVNQNISQTKHLSISQKLFSSNRFEIKTSPKKNSFSTFQ